MKKRSRWGIILTGLLTLFAALYLLPTFMPKGQLPQWYPFKKRLSFGLDLQGGLEPRYTVDYKKAITDNLRREEDSMAEEIIKAMATRDGKNPDALGEKEIKDYRSRFTIDLVDFDTLELVFKNPKDVELITPEFARKLRSDLVRLPPKGNRITLKLSDRSVIQIRDEVVNQTLDVIRKRVEAFGLVEPDIRKNGDTDIDVQLPGVGKEQMAIIRERIGQTA